MATRTPEPGRYLSKPERGGQLPSRRLRGTVCGRFETDPGVAALPCHHAGMPNPASPEERAAFLSAHPAWSVAEEALVRTFALADFGEAMGFVTRVALAAEAADHHPDLEIRWHKVTVTLTTHSAAAVTNLDLALAARIDGFVQAPGRRPPTGDMLRAPAG